MPSLVLHWRSRFLQTTSLTVCNVRILNGNPLTGVIANEESVLGAHTSEVTLIPEGDDVHEIFGWMLPRFKDFSTSRSYFTWLQGKKAYNLDARLKGGERHMIMSGGVWQSVTNGYLRWVPHQGQLSLAILTAKSNWASMRGKSRRLCTRWVCW